MSTDPVADFDDRRERIRADMGGADKLARVHAQGRRTVREHIAAFHGAAGTMRVDEIIDPAHTRPVLARYLGRFGARPFRSGADRPLASWPTCW